jgi:hypothetical protein
MKRKLFTRIGLVIIVAAVGLRVWLHPAAPPAKTAKVISPDMSGPPVDTAKVVMPNTVASQTPHFRTVKLVDVPTRPSPEHSPGEDSPVTDRSGVQAIVDTHVRFEKRLNAIRSLSGNLTDGDWKVLQQFLLTPDGLDKGQLGQVIKNELLDELCAQNPPPIGLGDVLTQMYRDQQQNKVIRDYAVQHLVPYYEQINLQPDSARTEQALRDVLWEASDETGDSIGGTALLALQRLSKQYNGFDQGKIATKALQMAADNNASELAHITAFQVCAQLGIADAVPVILQAAQSGQTISVKLSAIGALGQLGGSEQLSFLNSVMAGTEDRLKPATRHALEQITKNQMASQKSTPSNP